MAERYAGNTLASKSGWLRLSDAEPVALVAVPTLTVESVFVVPADVPVVPVPVMLVPVEPVPVVPVVVVLCKPLMITVLELLLPLVRSRPTLPEPVTCGASRSRALKGCNPALRNSWYAMPMLSSLVKARS